MSESDCSHAPPLPDFALSLNSNRVSAWKSHLPLSVPSVCDGEGFATEQSAAPNAHWMSCGVRWGLFLLVQEGQPAQHSAWHGSAQIVATSIWNTDVLFLCECKDQIVETYIYININLRKEKITKHLYAKYLHLDHRFAQGWISESPALLRIAGASSAYEPSVMI